MFPDSQPGFIPTVNLKQVLTGFIPTVNLKQVLMELGNRLVIDHGFDPCGSALQSCTKIQDFTEWVNEVPEAQQVLRELGVEWPMPKYSDRVFEDTD